jgi:hypothetical protein
MSEAKLNKDGVEAGKLLSPKEYQKAYAASQAKKRAAARKAKK